jgi:hypothetical protein
VNGACDVTFNTIALRSRDTDPGNCDCDERLMQANATISQMFCWGSSQGTASAEPGRGNADQLLAGKSKCWSEGRGWYRRRVSRPGCQSLDPLQFLASAARIKCIAWRLRAGKGGKEWKGDWSEKREQWALMSQEFKEKGLNLVVACNTCFESSVRVWAKRSFCPHFLPAAIQLLITGSYP